MENQLDVATQKLELAKQYFDAYPAEEAVYITSDNQVFLQKNQHDGYNHQKSIDEKKSLLTVLRRDVYPKAEAPQDPSESPDESWTNADIIDWLKSHGVETKGTKAELLAEVETVLLGDPDKDNDDNN